MELLRALGAVIEKPDGSVVRLAAMLELPTQPTVAEHAFLFDQQLVPRASRYLSADGAPSRAICDRIANFWRAAGATPPAAEPDHLSRLLGFYADLVDTQAREADDARRHAVGRLRQVVLWEHLLTWLPAYLTQVDLIAPHVYRRWGQLVSQVAAREAWLVSQPVAHQPSVLAELAALPDPGGSNVEGLVAHLSAPARSGMILAPVDLHRAADTLHVPAPGGPIPDALASLLEVRHPEMIEWLAAEARRWEARHERNREMLPALSDHWVRRAHSTRAALQTLARAVSP
jgi:TorA maturation chaperone TorD